MKRLTSAHFAVAFIVAILIAAGATVAIQRRQPASGANIEGLKEVLQKSAETAFPAPTLANERIEIAASDPAARADAILVEATQLGGTAVARLSGSNQITILASIPGLKAGAFRQAVTGQAGDAPPASSERQLIEVVIVK